ncbi:hypothetical protein SADUNF_Sadunf13G0013300 [Salix dunnii]|uniref:Uncharacterized protein n=1 Tax=Salix dunnii TaxID=1413687 RepID=A0A835MLC4_9ROSI|nr:hypothetical protein SADUNF_Sadunf13G0013300 [Salix dunnii]
MADAKTKVESVREWVVEHKLRTVVHVMIRKQVLGYGCAFSLWADHTSIYAVIVVLLDFWLHAQALTLAALAGAALVEYFDHKSGAKAERYAKFVPPKG